MIAKLDTHMNQLINYIKTYVALSDEECEVFTSLFEIRKLRNNEVFFEEGQIANELYFVTTGCIRLFYKVDVDEKTAFFYSHGQFICAGESYNLGIAAKENYQSIATENELIASQKIIASFVTQTAEERYLELLESNSELFQNVPQQYIASFLGVSPETLSRIKSRVLKR
jgi:CRP-like cAMP-binding protein